ncbi:UNVERIFIED_CONTAM: hypothetical protein Slati_4405100 [Sesamum latifolium]|uniref:Uncharacterized protein n=1 Tax=Sesamum latifolium TaxID=2727402 RepID=A0AAW2SPL2_9LAMI
MDKAARRSRAQQPARWRGRQPRACRVRAHQVASHEVAGCELTRSQATSSRACELAGRWRLEADGHCFGKESLT